MPKLKNKLTFIEAVETQYLNFEIPIEGHLTINVFTKRSFSSSRAPSNSNDNPLNWLLDDTVFSDFQQMLHYLNMKLIKNLGNMY